MKRFVYFSTAGIALLLASPLLTLSIWLTATSGPHVLRTDEREHIQAATQFIDAFKSTHARLPNNEEFKVWTEQMDAQGYRYDGKGFGLDVRCGHKELDYCLGFWTGEVSVTYRSWQQDKSTADIDGNTVFYTILLSTAVALGLVGLSIRLFNYGRTRTTFDAPAQTSGAIGEGNVDG
jgi:hypothetical protein